MNASLTPEQSAMAATADAAGQHAADPYWYKDAVIYQLHVKSFFDANNDGIGDFPGLLAKLDYIVELGVDTVWLLPFYPSPRRDDGYDIAQYCGVHPDYGNLDDARRFVEAAHARNLRVITELVINHTSDQHPWFQRARKAPAGSPERDFYVWSDDNETYAGTRIIFCDTEKSNWTWDAEAGAYFWHRFYSHQPDLNFDNPAVMEEVLAVMRFWLDIGVDGLRLDAVPYLIEREGTSNENLPETHDILKRIRTEVDAAYPGRMLLAEANMWPEDVQQYFGQGADGLGDECHMAFHFPLMPRMYMAIAREDRHPITDIMRQTPDIPANCQWAIFLRNHDELTLEMVTSSERDYLWKTYAAESRARINLGIRRRLAPLMERDRRRVELMNSLLFSMPGTPVMYYGDEIGMGDNIHLGDRDGVRTPMQWSPDRNGGFSRADPEALVLPPIMSALYGFEAVNVETQTRDPHSLLNWTRRMLALRREHRAFGRGTLRFLRPGNRKVLAYLREHDGEVILCVANLARSPQAVELDLSQYAGRVPVELFAGNSFPAVGQLTYLLTLPPHGFYWFALSTTAAPPEWHSVAPRQMTEFVTLVLNNRAGSDLTPGSRMTLENEVLPSYLANRRWFASKGEPLKGARIGYAAPIPGAPEVFTAEVIAAFDDRTEHYQLPFCVLWDEEEDNLPALPKQLALARVRRGPRVGVLTDAFSLERYARGIVAALRARATAPAGDGRLEFRPEAGIDDPKLDGTTIQWLSAEQSNSSLVIEGAAMLKVVRRVAGGIHPEAEMTRYLTVHGYRNTAALLGEVVRIDAEGTPHTLVLLQSAIANQGDGWEWTLNELRRLVEYAALPANISDTTVDPLAVYSAMAATLGQRLAELHAVLSMPSDDQAFDPVAATADDAAGWAGDAAELLDEAARLLGKITEFPNTAAKDDAAFIIAQAGRWSAVTERLATAGVGSLRTRVHGDFHLGQVLIALDDAYLIDFEGEPAQPLERRRRKASPMRDVAGMLRSFDYAVETVRALPTAGAAAATGSTTNVAATPPQERREELLNAFRSASRDRFLGAYRATAAAAPRRWVEDDAAEMALLDLFLLEKAAYEIRYEVANRPTWVGVPLRGLADIARRLLGAGDAPQGSTT